MDIFLFNSLNRKKEKFIAIKDDFVGIYTCGPTVYDYAHLGNLRTYLFEDFLIRTLRFNGYSLKRVMNITDVGHLIGDMDLGDDKLELRAKKEGRSAWEIASYYTDHLREDLTELNIISPDIWCRASESIKDQIALAIDLERKGYLYKISDGLYFDTAKFPNYNRLSHLPLSELREGARVEKHPEKKNPTDFAVWKLSPVNSKRQMEWESPWGIGFPGWHLECSAMSLKYLNNNLDIHCGGIDHINIHHTNEIAQSEAATGKKFFNYWLHGAFLNIKGGKKMSKSLDNFLSLNNAILKKGINPLAYRLAVLQVHYRKPMEYSEDSLRQAEHVLFSLYKQISCLGNESAEVDKRYLLAFNQAINDDLNMPQALAILFKMLKSDLKPEIKRASAMKFDEVLGLSLKTSIEHQRLLDQDDYPDQLTHLLDLREEARQKKDFKQSDKLRMEIIALGYIVEDTNEGQIVKKK